MANLTPEVILATVLVVGVFLVLGAAVVKHGDNPQFIVAVILACGILLVMGGMPIIRVVSSNASVFGPSDIAAAWRDVINVLIGALAGYIGGKSVK